MHSKRIGAIGATWAALLISYSASAIAGPYEDASAVAARGDYGSAALLYKKAIEQNDIRAYSALGLLLRMGFGVPKDQKLSDELYRKGAELGDARSQFVVGRAYYLGDGVPQSYDRAASWYRKAAENGDSSAQNMLGEMYAKGEGVKKDDAQAAAWIQKAADQQLIFAQVTLGKMYLSGKGVPQDAARAAALFEKAANSGKPGHLSGQLELGVLYLTGQGVAKSEERAVALINKAADRGYVPAQIQLANMYVSGLAVSTDDVQAYKWLTLAMNSVFNQQIRDEARMQRAVVGLRLSPAQIADAERLAAAWKVTR